MDDWYRDASSLPATPVSAALQAVETSPAGAFMGEHIFSNPTSFVDVLLVSQ